MTEKQLVHVLFQNLVDMYPTLVKKHGIELNLIQVTGAYEAAKQCVVDNIKIMLTAKQQEQQRKNQQKGIIVPRFNPKDFPK